MVSRFQAVLTAAALVCAAAPTVAAAGRVVVAAAPKREKIVAQDGSGDVKTIGEALASITDASASNPYRVTVKPGTYVEQVTMKPHVDLVGSGRSNTKITSSGDAGPTVLMATGTRLADVFVEKTLSWREEAPAIMVGQNDAVAIEGVRAEGSFGAILFGTQWALTYPLGRVRISDTVAVGHTNFGIRVGYYGSYDVTVEGVTASCEAVGEGDQCHGISLWFGGGGAVLRAANSTFRGNQAFVHYGPDVSSAEFRNCTFEASGAPAGSSDSTWNVGLFVHNGPTTVSNSRIRAVGPQSRGVVVESAGTLEMNGSEISGETEAMRAHGSQLLLKVGTSRIAGPVSGVAKVVNCHDAEYNPIPNQ